MGQFFAYSLQSAICLALFYLFFKVLLSRDTFHRFNRIALLGVLAFSLIMPLIAVAPITDAINKTDIGAGISSVIDKDIIPHDMNVEKESSGPKNIYFSWLLLAYLIGCTICLIYTITSIVRIMHIIHKGKCIKTDNGAKIIISDIKDIHPFSWMNYVIISQDDYDEAGEAIIAHEKAHIALRHTHDLIIAQLCIITQWFNPAIWLLYQELHNIHEYEADDKVLHQGIDARQYQLLLIKKAVGTRLYSMANSFNHSNLKKRITMMLQKKSNSWARLKYAYVLPLAVITVTAFASPEISEQFEEISSAKISHFALETSINEVKNLSTETEMPELPLLSPEESSESLNFPADLIKIPDAPISFSDDTIIYEVTEEKPQFPGGYTALNKWIADHINYPEEAKRDSIQGNVTIGFVIEIDGSISGVKVLRSLHPKCDEEAIQAVKSLPKFAPGKQRGKPVRVYFSAPIRFRMAEK